MNKELLYWFDDTWEIFFSRNYYKVLIYLWGISLLRICRYAERTCLFHEQKTLRERYPDTDGLLTAFVQTIKYLTVTKPNLSTEIPKLYEDVSLWLQKNRTSKCWAKALVLYITEKVVRCYARCQNFIWTWNEQTWSSIKLWLSKSEC